MKEVALDKLTLITRVSDHRWVQYAQVSGAFSFPVDMLRYDGAAPANFSLTDGPGAGVALKPDTGPHLIVGRIVGRKNQPWTIARWNSFSWSVKPLKTLKYVKGA